MRYRVDLSPAAQRQLRRLGRQARDRLAEAIYSLEESPRPSASVKLRGFDRVWRLRVGRFRVVYEILDDENLVVILRVALRSETTYRGL